MQTGSARGCFSFESGAQSKFGGENKPSGETALYYSEAKLLYRTALYHSEAKLLI